MWWLRLIAFIYSRILFFWEQAIHMGKRKEEPNNEEEKKKQETSLNFHSTRHSIPCANPTNVPISSIVYPAINES